MTDQKVAERSLTGLLAAALLSAATQLSMIAEAERGERERKGRERGELFQRLLQSITPRCGGSFRQVSGDQWTEAGGSGGRRILEWVVRMIVWVGGVGGRAGGWAVGGRAGRWVHW